MHFQSGLNGDVDDSPPNCHESTIFAPSLFLPKACGHSFRGL